MGIFSIIKKSKYWYLYALMFAFLLLKTFRGVLGAESSGGGIWNAIQILFVLIGIVFFFSKYKKRSLPIGVLLTFSLWAMVASFLHFGLHPIKSLSSWFYFFSTPCAPLVLLIFYCVAQEDDFRGFSFWIKATYYALIVIFYYSMTNYRTMGSDEYIAFSAIYFPLTLLPLVLVLTRPSRSYIPLIAIFVGCIVSGKRGGLISVALVAFVYYFFGKKRGFGKTILMLLFFAIVVLISSYLINQIDSTYGLHTIDKMRNTLDDGGSGRLWRWRAIWSALSFSSYWEIFFGHGFNTIYDLIGGRAHNDFLEIFYCFGFFALVLYVLFYLSMTLLNISQYKVNYPNAKYLTCSIIIAVVLAMVSFFVVDPTFVLSSMFTTGLLLGDWTRFLKKRYQIKE